MSEPMEDNETAIANWFPLQWLITISRFWLSCCMLDTRHLKLHGGGSLFPDPCCLSTVSLLRPPALS